MITKTDEDPGNKSSEQQKEGKAESMDLNTRNTEQMSFRLDNSNPNKRNKPMVPHITDLDFQNPISIPLDKFYGLEMKSSSPACFWNKLRLILAFVIHHSKYFHSFLPL